MGSNDGGATRRRLFPSVSDQVAIVSTLLTTPVSRRRHLSISNHRGNMLITHFFRPALLGLHQNILEDQDLSESTGNGPISVSGTKSPNI